MLKESFIGRRPSHFHPDPIVKAFILSEVFLWSAWNFITPIFAIFAATKITGGGVEIAASSFSAYLVSRVVFELISGKYLNRSTEAKKFIATICGIVILTVAYVGFALTTSVLQVYIFYSIMGAGLGISSPPKNSLFSQHLDREKETTEWSIYDASVFASMALAAIIGGLIAQKYGFHTLFLLCAFVNLLAVIPYVLYLRHAKSH